MVCECVHMGVHVCNLHLWWLCTMSVKMVPNPPLWTLRLPPCLPQRKKQTSWCNSSDRMDFSMGITIFWSQRLQCSATSQQPQVWFQDPKSWSKLWPRQTCTTLSGLCRHRRTAGLCRHAHFGWFIGQNVSIQISCKSLQPAIVRAVWLAQTEREELAAPCGLCTTSAGVLLL